MNKLKFEGELECCTCNRCRATKTSPTVLHSVGEFKEGGGWFLLVHAMVGY